MSLRSEIGKSASLVNEKQRTSYDVLKHEKNRKMRSEETPQRHNCSLIISNYLRYTRRAKIYETKAIQIGLLSALKNDVMSWILGVQ